MLLDGVAEAGDPVPALPLRERAAHAALDRIERGVPERARRELVVAGVVVLRRLRRDARRRRRERRRGIERGRRHVERRHRHLERQDDRRRRAARDLLVAGRQHLGHAQERTRGSGIRERLVRLEAAQRLAVDRAAQAAQSRLLAGADARRREDRLLDVALDDLVAEQADVAAACTPGARRVGDDATNLRKQRIPGREHDLAAAAQAHLGQDEQRDAAVVDGLEHRFRGGLQHADELVHRPDVELVEVAGLAADADQVRVGVAEEAACALRVTQDVVEERVGGADEIRAATRVHRLVEHDAEAVAGLIAARPEVAERPRLTIALDREVVRSERIGGVHEGQYPTFPDARRGPA